MVIKQLVRAYTHTHARCTPWALVFLTCFVHVIFDYTAQSSVWYIFYWQCNVIVCSPIKTNLLTKSADDFLLLSLILPENCWLIPLYLNGIFTEPKDDLLWVKYRKHTLFCFFFILNLHIAKYCPHCKDSFVQNTHNEVNNLFLYNTCVIYWEFTF